MHSTGNCSGVALHISTEVFHPVLSYSLHYAQNDLGKLEKKHRRNTAHRCLYSATTSCSSIADEAPLSLLISTHPVMWIRPYSKTHPYMAFSFSPLVYQILQILFVSLGDEEHNAPHRCSSTVWQKELGCLDMHFADYLNKMQKNVSLHIPIACKLRSVIANYTELRGNHWKSLKLTKTAPF